MAAQKPKEPPKVPGTNLSNQVGGDVEELREVRAERIEEKRAKSEAKDEAIQKEAKASGLHEAKLDDAGALEQQKAARDNEDADALEGLEGPPVVAPVIEDSDAKVKIISRQPGEAESSKTKSVRFVGHVLALTGEGFDRGEVIIDIRRENQSDHQRFSAWSEDGTIDVPVPGINGIGDWLLHCEQLTTEVGEGREDGLPLVKETDELAFELF